VERLPVLRSATRRRFLMCPPTHFAVTYAINPWMDPDADIDVTLAMAQWESLRDTYLRLGHEVATITPVAGLPDMVFAANGALVVDGITVASRFRYPERRPEAAAYAGWLRANGYAEPLVPDGVHEAEGDLLVTGDVILAGTGFRTEVSAHRQIAAWTGREVLTLRLVDPRYYHLDVAACILDDTTIAYLPEAFDDASRRLLEQRFPDAVIATRTDAEVLGLNAVSDGRHVVLPAEATDLASALAARGFATVAVDLSELRKAGGGPKCCTMELRPTADAFAEVGLSA